MSYPSIIRLFKRVFGALKKQNPRSGSRPGVENFSGWRPLEVGAVWVSGAPVAKPIPIKIVNLFADRARRIPRSQVRAWTLNACKPGKLRVNGLQHGLSP